MVFRNSPYRIVWINNCADTPGACAADIDSKNSADTDVGVVEG
jgi:hypothetical protein